MLNIRFLQAQRDKQASQVEQLVLLEEELNTEKAALEPARRERENAKAEIVAQRERMEVIDVRVLAKNLSADKLKLYVVLRTALLKLNGSASKPNQTKRTMSRKRIRLQPK